MQRYGCDWHLHYPIGEQLNSSSHLATVADLLSGDLHIQQHRIRSVTVYACVNDILVQHSTTKGQSDRVTSPRPWGESLHFHILRHGVKLSPLSVTDVNVQLGLHDMSL